jgi:hypothetical protein
MMLVLSPSGGPVAISGAPVPLTLRSWLVTKLTVKPKLGQWSKILIGGPDLLPDESNAIAVLYPVPNGGEADAFVVQDPSGKNTIDLSQIYVYATIPGDTPLADSFYYRTV